MRALALVMIGGCATAGVGAVGTRALVLSPDNRVVVSDFSYVTAVAASSWLVFAATPHGLIIYDRATWRFRPPVTALDGYPAGRVRRAIADPSGNAVWLDLGGNYARYDVDGRAWTGGLFRGTGAWSFRTSPRRRRARCHGTRTGGGGR